MPVVHGNEGAVAIGADTVAKVQDFTLTIEAPVSDATGMGDQWEDHELGAAKRWTGSINAKRVKDDDGQNALVAGAQVTLHLYGEGDVSGEKYYSGIATVTSVGRSQNRSDTVDVSFDFTGKGELTQPTVA
ncbi:hypothetical protein [Roseibium polysiphoniae]|uniref:Phage tail tube protein n=1 Tax=Roseibium polysiphoniae TaxID=2571221 RepID=A0ABR9C7C6_9HYPH|nr:hypothetical protein [Roseibium polysiphoniae]MBD8875434.1 hypothetical protein [Roseibium polysiphoniae]